MTNNPYATPGAATSGYAAVPPGTKPDVVFWFRVYAAVMGAMGVLTGLLIMAMGVLAMTANEPGADDVPMWLFVMIGVMAIATSAIYWLPFYFGNRPWVWTYSLVVICLGMGSCTIVAALPLLIYWLKPETKAYFGVG